MIKEECGTFAITASSMTMKTMKVMIKMAWIETQCHTCLRSQIFSEYVHKDLNLYALTVSGVFT